MWMAVGLACLIAPVTGSQTAPFAPEGAYAGHWGVDFTAAEGSAVKAPLSGTVSFAGSVAGMQTVTIEQGENQQDPSDAGPFAFDVTFSEDVTGFAADDVVVTGTRGPRNIDGLAVADAGDGDASGPALRFRLLD